MPDRIEMRFYWIWQVVLFGTRVAYRKFGGQAGVELMNIVGDGRYLDFHRPWAHNSWPGGPVSVCWDEILRGCRPGVFHYGPYEMQRWRGSEREGA